MATNSFHNIFYYKILRMIFILEMMVYYYYITLFQLYHMRLYATIIVICWWGMRSQKFQLKKTYSEYG